MRRFILPLLLLLPITACTQQPQGGQTIEIDTGDEKSEEENPKTDDPVDENPTENLISKTVVFKDGTFIGQLEHTTTQNNFVSYFNGSDDLLTSISFTGKSESKEIEFKTKASSEKHVVWWLGSSEATGQLTFNFKYSVSKINITAQAYYKPYVDTWSGSEPVEHFNVDTNSSLLISDTTYDLKTSEDTTPKIKNLSKTYTTPTKSIILKNGTTGQRVFIHSIEVLYSK